MSDVILESINTNYINNDNISFNLIRQIGGRNLDIRGQLGYGRNVLSSHDQLDQYLYTYGPMVQSQWANLLSWIELPEGNIEIIDYACGQGLATLLLFDNSRLSRDNVKIINLIEPSNVAVTRAAGVLARYCPDAVIKTTCKTLDNIEKEDIDISSDSTKVHLFSNILDVEGFDMVKVFNKALATKGPHLILAVSHDRDHNGGSPRVKGIYDVIIRSASEKTFSIREDKIDQFTCANSMPAIAFFVNLERV